MNVVLVLIIKVFNVDWEGLKFMFLSLRILIVMFVGVVVRILILVDY